LRIGLCKTVLPPQETRKPAIAIPTRMIPRVSGMIENPYKKAIKARLYKTAPEVIILFSFGSTPFPGDFQRRRINAIR